MLQVCSATSRASLNHADRPKGTLRLFYEWNDGARRNAGMWTLNAGLATARICCRLLSCIELLAWKGISSNGVRQSAIVVDVEALSCTSVTRLHVVQPHQRIVQTYGHCLVDQDTCNDAVDVCMTIHPIL